MMALHVRNGYEELQYQLEEIRDQGYFYVGEYVFAGSNREGNRISVDAFHLWNVPHGAELDRIVMLFADFSAREAVMLVIEGSCISCSKSANGRFLLDVFEAMGKSVHSERVEETEFDGITGPIRLIYQKPLFLMLLYRCNLLLEGHSLWTLIHTDPEQRTIDNRKDKETLENIRQELRAYFELDQWEERIGFRDSNRVHDALTKQINELSKYLDGLRVIRQELAKVKDTGEDAPGVAVWRQRCQRIDEMTCVVKDKLRKLERSGRMGVPFAMPERTVALWHMEEAFPGDMSFGEMISVRTQLEHTLHDLQRKEPSEEMPKRRELWGYRLGCVHQQIWQMEKLLEAKLQDHELEWEDYLV